MPTAAKLRLCWNSPRCTMQMMATRDREIGWVALSNLLSKGVSAMTLTNNLSLLIALGGMLVWLYTALRAQRATAVIPVYARIPWQSVKEIERW